MQVAHISQRALLATVLFVIPTALPTICNATEHSDAEISARHADMRLSSEVGYQESRGAFIATQFRYGVHDFLDRRGDYPHSTAIEFGVMKWRVHLENTPPWLDELTLLRVTRIPTLSENDGELSWEFDTGLRTAREEFCAHCLTGHVRGGLGITEAPISRFPMEVFLLAEAELSMAPGAFQGAFQPAIGPWAGIRFWWTDNFNALVSARSRYYFLTKPLAANWEASAAVRYYLGWDLSAEARVCHHPDGWESAAGLYVYF